MFKKAVQTFFTWYDKHQNLNTVITAVLFCTQLLHLFWLATHVLALRLFDESYFTPNEAVQNLIVIFDYFEIPALISATLLYGRRLHKQYTFKSLRNLLFVNVQYLHIFWITDEFAEAIFTGQTPHTILPAWLALVAIVIDYLELPVIYETLKDTASIIKNRKNHPQHTPK